MRRIFVLLLLLPLAIMASFAQTQQGYVKTKGRLGSNGSLVKGTRLSGATVTVKGQNAVLSGSNGTFTLAIPSTNFYLQNVQKQGYVITDPDALSRQYAYSKNPLVLVLEDKNQLEAERRSIERKISNKLYAQLQSREEEIESLKNQKKITEEKYRELLQKLNNDQDANERIIKDMTDRYASMDFDQIDDFNRRISDCIINGRLTEADSLLRTKGDISARTAELRQLQEQNAKDEEKLKKEKKVLEKNKDLAQKKMDDIAQDCYSKYEIFKMQHQNDSAMYYIEYRVRLDSSNIGWLREAGYFVYSYMADYPKALQLYQTAVEKCKSTDDKKSLAHLYNDIGLVLSDKGDDQKALEYYQLALPIWKDLYGECNPDLASTIGNIGCLFGNKDDHEQELKYAQQAMDMNLRFRYENIDKINNGEIEDNLQWIGIAYINMGVILHHLNKLEDAMTNYMKADSIYRELQLEETPDYASLISNIGHLYGSMKDYNLAMDYQEKALKLRLKMLEPNHPDVANSYKSIGDTFFHLGEYDKSLESHQKALDIRKSKLGKNHPSIISSYNSMAVVMSKKKEYKAAENYHKESLTIIRNLYGDSHPTIATTYFNMAGLNAYQGNYDEAISLYEKAKTIWISFFGKDYPSVEKAEKSIEIVRRKAKKSEETGK